LQGSVCDTLNLSAYEETNSINEITIAPNPFNMSTLITFNDLQKNTLVTINDTYGNVIKRVNFTGTQLIIEKEKLKSGIYFLQIIDENLKVVNKKIIIY
jgi:hypothetical protein